MDYIVHFGESDLNDYRLVCYVDRQSGGAFQTMEYAKKIGKTVINLADPD